MKILLIGASSYVGARLFLDLQKDHEIIGTYHTEHLLPEFVHLDITDVNTTSKFIIEQEPDIIIHTANNASVKWCEANPEKAKRLNEDSTKTLVDAANTISAQFVYISSFAANNPVHVYGKTKLASEEITKQAKYGWLIIRPSLIVGVSPNTTNDRFFNRILSNIDNGTNAIYDSSWKLQLTSLSHVSEVIMQAISQKVSRKIIPIAIDDAKTQYDFAKSILEPYGIKVVVQDKGAPVTEPHINLNILNELEMPKYSYAEVINKIASEIVQR